MSRLEVISTVLSVTAGVIAGSFLFFWTGGIGTPVAYVYGTAAGALVGSIVSYIGETWIGWQKHKYYRENWEEGYYSKEELRRRMQQNV